MTTTEPAVHSGLRIHGLPADHADIVAAVQQCATATAGPAHPVEVLDVLVLDAAPRQPHTVEVLAEEFDAADHALLFMQYAVDTETLAVREYID